MPVNASATVHLGTIASQDASAVAITGGSGAFTGALSTTGNLSVTGTSTLNNSVTTNNNVQVNGTLNATGAVSFGSTLTASSGAATFGSVTITNALVTMSAPIHLKSYTIATLPAHTAGDSAYCTNVRVFNGLGAQEGAGGGTGGAVESNGSAWKVSGTNATATA